MHGRPINGQGMLCAPLVAVLGTQVLFGWRGCICYKCCVHDRRSSFAGPDLCMTGKHLLDNAVCNTGSSVRHTSAECMAGKTIARTAVCKAVGVLLQNLMYAR